ncbi:hypothetical protein C8R44DRAFT_787415, partial [Mycena epipterygia]
SPPRYPPSLPAHPLPLLLPYSSVLIGLGPASMTRADSCADARSRSRRPLSQIKNKNKRTGAVQRMGMGTSSLEADLRTETYVLCFLFNRVLFTLFFHLPRTIPLLLPDSGHRAPDAGHRTDVSQSHPATRSLVFPDPPPFVSSPRAHPLPSSSHTLPPVPPPHSLPVFPLPPFVRAHPTRGSRASFILLPCIYYSLFPFPFTPSFLLFLPLSCYGSNSPRDRRRGGRFPE